ncbi:MAG TPA: YqgE/AlgH family protein [Burkholderiales bacterium]|nr:YqgE/AlgH family protein [Burkholderiales bacterium]
MRRRIVPMLCVAALAAPQAAWAQEPEPAQANAVFLVAKPTLLDPNFSHTVVLATRTPDAGTIGVILNRPTRFKASDVLPPDLPAENYRDSIYFGGPVMLNAIVAVFHAAQEPSAPAYHALENVYLTMHRDTIEALLREPGQRYRLYMGFSGWAPRQLESELLRKDWYVLPADESSIFREDTRELWNELLRKASAERTSQAAARAGALSKIILPPR